MRKVIEVEDKKKRAEDYLCEPYARIVIPCKESGTYTAQVLEFPGCITEGDTIQEAYERLEEAAKSWIEAALDSGQEIPAPASVCDYGGKVALRLPKSLHRQAALAAERDGTSLNQFIVIAVAEKVGAARLCGNLIERLETRAIQTTVDAAARIVTQARAAKVR
ncbi:MAG: type II toxin-antitoxin system HicB family antitoxin [Chloroflexi bacterium]|nr:type II toxin-antitoxin system HicB family antitoxin [Chloroflexota bacterium]